MTQPEYLTNLNELRDELAHQVRQKRMLLGCIEESCGPELEKIRELECQREALQQEQENILAAARHKADNLYRDLSLSEGRIKKKIDEIKRYCHSHLPLSVMEKGLSVGKGSSVKIRVNKTTIITSYDAERLVYHHPELEEMFLDGDPVIGRTIIPEVLERLIAANRFSKEDAAPYKHERKLKNPSVYVEVKDG